MKSMTTLLLHGVVLDLITVAPYADGAVLRSSNEIVLDRTGTTNHILLTWERVEHHTL